MSTKILFIFEGEKTEDQISASLQNFFFNDNTIIKCVFCAEISQLYRQISIDEDLDIFNLIKERNDINKDILKDFNRDHFAEIYLFFDYDPHTPLASSTDKYGNITKTGDQKLKDMLDIFDNETNNGKLYISYPMVEAIKHVIDHNNFKNLETTCKRKNCKYLNNCHSKIECLEEPNYKNKVSVESKKELLDITRYTIDIWNFLIKTHLYKMNYIVNNKYEYPSQTESQQTIFKFQLEKYLSKKCPTISVLSAFPIFIHDYYGNKQTYNLINN